MADMPLDAPVTRREFYLELMVVWLFLLLAALPLIKVESRWTAIILPVGALLMVLLHAVALRRGRSSTTAHD
jgi:hypothetical protein